MADVDGLITIQEAARRMGVSERQVQHLGANGTLVFVARGLVDQESVRAYLADRQGWRRQGWSQMNSWGAIALLSGVDADWLGQVQKFRINVRIRESDATELVSLTRARAAVRRYEGHASAASRLAAAMVVPDHSRLGLVDVGDDKGIDGYLESQRALEVVRQYGLVAEPSGRFTIRATDRDLATVRGIAESSTVLAALDAAISADPRARGVGLEALTKHLERYGHG